MAGSGSGSRTISGDAWPTGRNSPRNSIEHVHHATPHPENYREPGVRSDLLTHGELMALGVGRLPAAARRSGFWYLALLGCRRVECGHPRRDPKAVALRAADPFRLALADRHHYCELLPALLAGEFIGWHDPTLSVGNTVLQTTTSTGNATHRSPVGSLRLPYAPTSGGGKSGAAKKDGAPGRRH